MIQTETKASKEVLYAVNTDSYRNRDPRARFLSSADFAAWRELKPAFVEACSLSGAPTKASSRRAILACFLGSSLRA